MYHFVLNYFYSQRLQFFSSLTLCVQCQCCIVLRVFRAIHFGIQYHYRLSLSVLKRVAYFTFL
jgi:hypothetical protein